MIKELERKSQIRQTILFYRERLLIYGIFDKSSSRSSEYTTPPLEPWFGGGDFNRITKQLEQK